jgi:hypothetical protein
VDNVIGGCRDERQGTDAALRLTVVLAWTLLGTNVTFAQKPSDSTGARLPAGYVVREIVMRDARSATELKQRLEAFKSGGVYRQISPGPAPNTAITRELQFLVSGNILLVIGEAEWVEQTIEGVRLLAFMSERPRAHLQMNMRVVQISGPANAAVIQMSEAMQSLVELQREEVTRAFSDLEDYLRRRLKGANSPLKQFPSVVLLFPPLSRTDKPLTVPEVLLLLMLDRLSERTADSSVLPLDAMNPFVAFSRTLARVTSDPRAESSATLSDVLRAANLWRQAVERAHVRLATLGAAIEKSQGRSITAQLRESLNSVGDDLPEWMVTRLTRSVEITERVFPQMAKQHAAQALQELERRFEKVESDVERLLNELQKSDTGDCAPTSDQRTFQLLLQLKSVTDDLSPPPLTLFLAIAAAVDAVSPTKEQVNALFATYAEERAKLEANLRANGPLQPVNYAKLQSIEASLNLWLRRIAEALAQALEQQFYKRYTDDIRLLANKRLSRGARRSLLSEADLMDVPDVVRDILLSGSDVNIFLSNSISLQFTPDTTNTVSAQVQASLPLQQSIQDKLQQANQAASLVKQLSSTLPLDAEKIVQAILEGGQTVPVKGGIQLSANPSIGYDASTVSLNITTSQTLDAATDKLPDRVTNHTISNATITALSYEPLVLSTLASNLSYYEYRGGIPILRKMPLLKEAVNDIPITPLRPHKEQKGMYQASVLILEPVVIPTIEDMVRYHSGWRQDMLPNVPSAADVAAALEAEAKANAAANGKTPATPNGGEKK